MFEQMVEMLEEFAEKDPREFASFVAMVSIRNKIAAEEKVTLSMAGQIASQMNIELPADLSDEKIEQLTIPVAKVVNGVIAGMIEEGFDSTSIIHAASKMDLTLS